MELSAIELFKAMNGKHRNLKDCEGLIIKPVAFHTHTYDDASGKTHAVLVIKDGMTGEFFRTEVKAFIDKFMKYDEAFGSLADEEKPDIVIIINVSKMGNKYVNFDLANG